MNVKHEVQRFAWMKFFARPALRHQLLNRELKRERLHERLLFEVPSGDAHFPLSRYWIIAQRFQGGILQRKPLILRKTRRRKLIQIYGSLRAGELS
jgi:hypothetical protein